MATLVPHIVLTSGEPAGIGPDLCIALAELNLPCELVVVGDRRVFDARARQLGKQVVLRDYAAKQSPQRNTLTIAHLPTSVTVVPGRVDIGNARYVLNTLDYAVDGCKTGEFAAMVTAPVQKSVINDAGVAFTGHTEYLAERTASPQPVMMLVASCQFPDQFPGQSLGQSSNGALRVALATTHLPLSHVAAAITAELLTHTLLIIDRDLKEQFKIDAPRILVCGLNPHAGESGHLGREEIDVIAPVLTTLRASGMRLLGPVPADTAFTPHMLDQCDVVLAMFHDQGLPTLKYAGFGRAVNVTLGLPIVRTSVDHGTALDLAGTGKADVGSLVAAIELAIQLAASSRQD